jgi:hypothetical protein
MMIQHTIEKERRTMSRKHNAATSEPQPTPREHEGKVPPTVARTNEQLENEVQVGGFPWQFVTMAVAIVLGLLSIVLSSMGVF